MADTTCPYCDADLRTTTHDGTVRVYDCGRRLVFMGDEWTEETQHAIRCLKRQINRLRIAKTVLDCLEDGDLQAAANMASWCAEYDPGVINPDAVRRLSERFRQAAVVAGGKR